MQDAPLRKEGQAADSPAAVTLESKSWGPMAETGKPGGQSVCRLQVILLQRLIHFDRLTAAIADRDLDAVELRESVPLGAVRTLDP